MKRVILSLSCLITMTAAMGQLPLWAIRPAYDAIKMKLDKKVLATDSAGVTSLWTLEGKRLYTTPDQVMPYNEGYAVVMTPSKAITGFVDTDGHFTKVDGLSVAYEDPYFHDGLMICSNGAGFSYINTKGEKQVMAPAVKSYPFSHGFAPYMVYEQPEKLKDPHYRYYSISGNEVSFMLQGKKVEHKDVQFLSGISPAGKGVAVIKDKLYWFDATTSVLSPLLGGPETESEKKRHLELEGNYEEYFEHLPIDRDIEFRCKYGKKQIATLKFNQGLIPVSIDFNGELTKFEGPSQEAVAYATDLTTYGDYTKGLQYKGQDILPRQFEATDLAYGDRIFVKLGGKWGLLHLNPELNLKLTMNKGDDIAFRHQKFDTQIRLDFPSAISAKDLKLDIPASTGLELDRTSRTSKDTEYGNFVQYNCVLNIPRDLPDSITPIVYDPVKISYDGLKLLDRSFNVKAWHLKYYNVDPIDSETAVKNGVATFTVNIDAQRSAGDSDYPFEVRIVADSIGVDYEKLSETRYKCIVSNLKEGLNIMSVVITEKGCPSSFFPFEISYVKPVEKKIVESVSIRKISDLELPRLLQSMELPTLATPQPEGEAPAPSAAPATEPQAAPENTEAATDTPAAPQPVSPLTKMVLGM